MTSFDDGGSAGSKRPEFDASSSAEIHEALGVAVTYVLSDMPWSFRAPAANGETVGVWVSELPDMVTVDVRVDDHGVTVFSSTWEESSRLDVATEPPEIVIESTSGDVDERLEISLTPRLQIRHLRIRRDA